MKRNTFSMKHASPFNTVPLNEAFVIFLIGATLLCCNIVTIYYVNNITYINQQLLKVKILATCFSCREISSGQKWNIVLVYLVIVHCMGSQIVYILYYRSYVG